MHRGMNLKYSSGIKGVIPIYSVFGAIHFSLYCTCLLRVILLGNIFLARQMRHYIYCTVMANNKGSLLSENATLHSEDCCKCKCFGSRVILFFVYIGTAYKK